MSFNCNFMSHRATSNFYFNCLGDTIKSNFSKINFSFDVTFQWKFSGKFYLLSAEFSKSVIKKKFMGLLGLLFHAVFVIMGTFFVFKKINWKFKKPNFWPFWCLAENWWQNFYYIGLCLYNKHSQHHSWTCQLLID
jgi:hypothetical protein